MTPQIHLHVLASGSKGNAAVVEGPEGSVLVDCGISRRALLQRAAELGVDMGRVRAVVLTHDHSDHVAGLSVFCNHFEGRLIATAGTVGARKYLTELPFELVGHSDAFAVAGMHVQAFPTYHDVPDPMGFRFETNVQSALVVSHGTMGRLFKNHWKGLSQVEDIPHLSNCCVVTYAFDECKRAFSCVDIYQPSCATMPQNVLNHEAGK